MNLLKSLHAFGRAFEYGTLTVSVAFFAMSANLILSYAIETPFLIVRETPENLFSAVIALLGGIIFGLLSERGRTAQDLALQIDAEIEEIQIQKTDIAAK